MAETEPKDTQESKRLAQVARVQEAITKVYSKYLPRQKEILAEKDAGKAGWEKEFMKVRLEAMEELRGILPAIIKESPDLLKPEDWAPRTPGTFKPRDFRSSLIIKDPVANVYFIALVLDPQQGTSPHDHTSPCFENIYKGESLEYKFDHNAKEIGCHPIKNGTTTEINGYVSKELEDNNMHTVYNPQKLDLATEKPSRDKMTVQLHMYEGYNFMELEKGNLVNLMGPEVASPGNTKASYALAGHLAKSTGTWHKTDMTPDLQNALERAEAQPCRSR